MYITHEYMLYIYYSLCYFLFSFTCSKWFFVLCIPQPERTPPAASVVGGASLACGYAHTGVLLNHALHTWGSAPLGALGHGPQPPSRLASVMEDARVFVPRDQEVGGAKGRWAGLGGGGRG